MLAEMNNSTNEALMTVMAQYQDARGALHAASQNMGIAIAHLLRESGELDRFDSHAIRHRQAIEREDSCSCKRVDLADVDDLQDLAPVAPPSGDLGAGGDL